MSQEPHTDAGAEPLARVLRATPPPGVAALPDDVRGRLADQVRQARRRLEVEGEAATTKALRGVPLPVRGIVRRALS